MGSVALSSPLVQSKMREHTYRVQGNKRIDLFEAFRTSEVVVRVGAKLVPVCSVSYYLRKLADVQPSLESYESVDQQVRHMIPRVRFCFRIVRRDGTTIFLSIRRVTVMDVRIREKMTKAMQDLLDETFSQQHMSAADVSWIERLCTELRDRINALTPRRKDLHESLTRSFDVELIVQMLQHDAMDATDVRQAIDVVWERLGMLCAPVHDDEISRLRQETRSGRCSVAKMLCAANRIVDDVERMQSSPETLAFVSNFVTRER